MTNTCLKKSLDDLMPEESVAIVEQRKHRCMEAVHPGYYSVEDNAQATLAQSQLCRKATVPMWPIVLGTFLVSAVITIVGLSAIARTHTANTPMPRIVTVPLVEKALPVQASMLDLEVRFQKISTVLDFLVKKCQSPLPSSSMPEEPNDMLIATVITDKAYLRAGPGKQHSPLMAVTRGTRLVVERQEGEWLQVVSPTGEHMWVSASVAQS